MRTALLIISALAAGTPSYAQTQPASPPAGAGGMSAVCADLAVSYDKVAREIAKVDADGMGDDSAPRETNRQMRINSAYLKASIATQLLSANKCPMPKKLPDPADYGLAAINCRTAQLQYSTAMYGSDKAKIDAARIKESEACDTSKWTPGG